MESLGPQMVKAMAGYENIELRPIGKRSTGLSRPDFYNWPKVLEANLIDFKPQIVIMWVGTNDPQNIHGYKNLGEPLSKAWKEVYTLKIQEIINLCKAHRAKITFIGPPAVGEEPLDSQLRELERLIQKISQKNNQGYISSRKELGDNNGCYLHEKKMPEGHMATIRWKDRVHITGDGNRLMMHKLLPYMGEKIIGTPATKKIAQPTQQRKPSLKRRSHSSYYGNIGGFRGAY